MQVRGANSAVEELSFILRHSQSRGLVVDDPQLLDKLLPQLCSEGSASSNGSSNVRPAARTCGAGTEVLGLAARQMWMVTSLTRVQAAAGWPAVPCARQCCLWGMACGCSCTCAAEKFLA